MKDDLQWDGGKIYTGTVVLSDGDSAFQVCCGCSLVHEISRCGDRIRFTRAKDSAAEEIIKAVSSDSGGVPNELMALRDLCREVHAALAKCERYFDICDNREDSK